MRCPPPPQFVLNICSIKTPLISWSQFPLVAKNQKSKNHFVEAFGGGKNKIPLLNNLKEKRKPRI